MKKISKLLTILFVFVLTLSTVSVCVVSADSCGFTLSEKVYLGGFPIGLSTLGEGLYVDDFAVISTENGAVSPLKNKGIAKGDILLSVNGKAVSSKLLRKDVYRAVSGIIIEGTRIKESQETALP